MNVRRAPGDPVAFLQSLAAQGDVVPFSLYGHPAVLLNHPDYVDDVLVRSSGNFAKPTAVQRSSVLLGTGLFTAEGEFHRRRRRVVQPAFTPHRLDRYGETILVCAGHVHERWTDGQTIDMAAEMHRLALTIIGRVLFGTDLSSEAPVIRRALIAASASIDPLLSLLAPTRLLRPRQNDLRALVNRLIDQRCALPDDGDDVLTLLRRAEDGDGAVASEQLRDDLLTLFVAGHDTIANGLTWTWHLLTHHAGADARMREEITRTLGGRAPGAQDLPDLTYTGWVLAESLRLYPPSWVITRRALNEHDFGGTVVPAGTIVVVSQYLLHRDPRFFTNPLAFEPDRWGSIPQPVGPKSAYFPFGAGPRSCIGQGLATMEGVLSLAGIAQRWQLSAASPVEGDPRATLRPRGPVLMRVTGVDTTK